MKEVKQAETSCTSIVLEARQNYPLGSLHYITLNIRRLANNPIPHQHKYRPKEALSLPCGRGYGIPTRPWTGEFYSRVLQ